MKRNALLPGILRQQTVVTGLTAKCVGCWEFAETSGTVLADETSNGLDLTLENPYSYNGGAPTNLANSIRFVAGTNPVAYHADNVLLRTGGGKSFSYSIWVDFTSLGTGPYAIGSKINLTSNVGEWNMYVTGNPGTIKIDVFEEGDADVKITYVSDAGVITTTAGWQHIIFTYDGQGNANSGKIYVNDVDVTNTYEGVEITNTSDTASQFRIGTLDTGILDPNAFISQTAFFNGILTSDDRAELYGSGGGKLYINWS